MDAACDILEEAAGRGISNPIPGQVIGLDQNRRRDDRVSA
jgi:hypothetical protein